MSQKGRRGQGFGRGSQHSLNYNVLTLQAEPGQMFWLKESSLWHVDMESVDMCSELLFYLETLFLLNERVLVWNLLSRLVLF